MSKAKTAREKFWDSKLGGIVRGERGKQDELARAKLEMGEAEAIQRILNSPDWPILKRHIDRPYVEAVRKLEQGRALTDAERAEATDYMVAVRTIHDSIRETLDKGPRAEERLAKLEEKEDGRQ